MNTRGGKRASETMCRGEGPLRMKQTGAPLREVTFDIKGDDRGASHTGMGRRRQGQRSGNTRRDWVLANPKEAAPLTPAPPPSREALPSVTCLCS